MYAVPLCVVLLALLLETGGETTRTALRFDREAMHHGQLWRAVTAHFVHLGWYHCLLNLLGLAALLVLCPAKLSSREWLRRFAVLSIGISVALYLFSPQIETYVGLSGVLHGLFLLGLVPLARRRDLIAVGCLLFLGAKLAWEIHFGTPLSDEHTIGGRVVTQSHLFGTLAGLGYGLMFGIFRQGEIQA